MCFRRLAVKKCRQLFNCNTTLTMILLFVVFIFYICIWGNNMWVIQWNRNQTRSMRTGFASSNYEDKTRIMELSPSNLNLQDNVYASKNKLSTTASFHQDDSLEIKSAIVTEVYINGNNTKKPMKHVALKGHEYDIFYSINENMAIVTAFFDLGSFQKGRRRTYYPDFYATWSEPLAYLVNPLVVYTDSEAFANLMKKYRERFPLKTKILIIERNSTWAFQLIGQIRSVFSQPGHPKDYPTILTPEYACVQNAKYNLVGDAIRRKYFDTEFYAWIDVGYFRKYRLRTQYFRLETPPNMDKTKIAINRIRKRDMSDHPREIFRNQIIWVGGGMFIGKQDIMLKFEQLYLRAVKYFLNKNWMNTDQQVLYSIYCVAGREMIQPEVELQLYTRDPTSWQYRQWFYLGEVCRRVVTEMGISI